MLKTLSDLHDLFGPDFNLKYFKVRSAYLASGSRHWLNKSNTPELALCEFHAYLCLPLLSSSTKKGRHLFLPCKKVERIGASKSFA